MQNKQIIVIIGVLAGVLIFLAIMSAIISAINGNKTTAVSPTPFVRDRRFLNQQQQRDLILQTKASTKPLSSSQADALTRLQQKLPTSNADFDMKFSPTTDQFVIQKKSTDADSKINQFLNENGVSSINDYNRVAPIFVVSDQPVDKVIQQNDQDLLRKKQQSLQQPQEEPTPTAATATTPGATAVTPTTVPSTATKDVQLLSDLLKTLLSFNLGTSGGGGGGGGGGQAPGGSAPTGNIAPTLASIFTEAGTKVGISPKLLQAFMNVECGGVLTLPEDQIVAYSAPGAGIPPSSRCFGNSYGAHGPMQFINTTWARYATAVNRYGGYSYTPYIENIRDSVYAAAEMISLNGHAAAPFSWNQEEVFRAAKSYCGSCNAVACPNYCQHVWDIYSGP